MRPDVYIEPDLCQACDNCKARKACNMRAIVQFERGELPAIEIARCRGCLVCVPACPHGALINRAHRSRPEREI